MAGVGKSVRSGSGRAGDELEIVAVHVDGVAAPVVVVDYDFYHVEMVEDVGVGVLAVDEGVGGGGAGGEGGVEGGDEGFDEGGVVDCKAVEWGVLVAIGWVGFFWGGIRERVGLWAWGSYRFWLK